MASNHTTNYQLNQWVKSDRILMDDFNADNQKLEAALTALDRSAKLHTILDVTLDKDTTRAEYELKVNWAEWKTVYVDVVLASGSAGDLRVCYEGTTEDYITNLDATWNQLIGFPCGNPEMPLYFLIFKGNTGFFHRCPYVGYEHFRELQICNSNYTGTIKAGTRIRMMGERM